MLDERLVEVFNRLIDEIGLAQSTARGVMDATSLTKTRIERMGGRTARRAPAAPDLDILWSAGRW